MKIRQLERYIQPHNLIIILMILGFLSGMLMAFALRDGEDSGQILWLDHILIYLKYGEVQYGEVLFYVLKQRLFLIFMIAILCLSNKGKYLLLGGVGIAGGFAGYFISQFIMAKGILGSILFGVSIFPQYLFYGYAYYHLLLLLFGKKEWKIGINQNSQKETGIYYKNENYFIKKAVPFVVVIIGILLECYVNPLFLKLFLKIFM